MTRSKHSAKSHAWELAGFDLDGTLVYGTSVLLHVGARLGDERLVKRLMQGYESYELSNQDVATAAAKLFEGLSRPELHNLVTDIPRLEDIRPCIRILKEAGVECLVATITFDFAAEWFASEYGFDGYSGIQLEFDSKGLATGNISKHFDENDKAEFIKREYRRRGLACDRVFYVGDSRSDLPTFSIVGHSVALNATPEAIRKATTHANGKSLVDALVTIPGLEYMISNLRFGH